MSFTSRTYSVPAITGALLAAALGVAVLALPLAPGGPALAQGPAQATVTPVPPTPSPTPPWPTAVLPGGPASDVAVGPQSDRTVQRVYAASNELLVSHRGDEWQAQTGTGPLIHLLAGPDGVVFGTTPDGDGYYTRNAGRYWTRLTVRGDAPVHFLAVSTDYQFDKTIYATTRDDWRLYRSSTEGSAWQEIQMELDVRDQYGAVAFSPLFRADETLFVGTQRGIFRWTSQARRWTLVSTAAAGAPAFGPTAGPATSQGLLVVHEYGDDPYRRHDPDVRTLFAYTASAIYRSDDDAQTWTQLSLPPNVTRVNDVVVSSGWPTDPTILVAVSAPGVIGLVSQDGGATWQTVSGRDGMTGTGAALAWDFWPRPEPDRPYPHFAFLPIMLKTAALGAIRVPGREMYLATDGNAVYRSRDRGRTWQPAPDSYAAVRVTALAYLPGGPSAPVLAGTEASGLYRSEDGGLTWRWLDVGLPRGADQTIYRIRVSPAFASDRTVFLATTSGVWASRDGGATWSRTPGPAPARDVALSPDFGRDRTVMAVDHISRDGGATWSPLAAPLGPWATVAFSPGFPADDTLWAGTDQVPTTRSPGLFRSVDGGSTWVPITATAAIGEELLSLLAFRVDPGEPARIFAGTGRGLFGSTDGGSYWRRMASTASPIQDLTGQAVRLPYVRGVVLAATQEGAVWSTTRGDEWVNEPRSPRDVRAVALSDDATVLLIAAPMRVARHDLSTGGGGFDLLGPWRR